MKYKYLLHFIFLFSMPSFGQISFGKFKIKIDNDCGIEFGKLQITKPIKNIFRFRIDVNNKAGYTGAIDGYAKIIAKDKASFHKKDCDLITFTFLPGNVVQIKEFNCHTYHGANICFDGYYQQY